MPTFGSGQNDLLYLQQRRNSRQISPPPAWFSQQLSSPKEKQNIYLGDRIRIFVIDLQDANKKLILKKVFLLITF
jgi:hypothetical protein